MKQLALRARVMFTIEVRHGSSVTHSFVTAGNAPERRGAQLVAAAIAQRQMPGSRIYFKREPLGDYA